MSFGLSPSTTCFNAGAAAAVGPNSCLPAAPPATVHVLHVINGEHYAGAERVQDLLSARLPNFGFNVSLVSVKPGQFAAKRQHREAPLIELPMRHKFDIHAARELAKLVTRERVQVIHAHTPRTAMLGRMAALWTGVPLVYHVHSPTARDTTHRWRNMVNTWSERLSLVGVARLICVSHSLAGHMERAGYSANFIRVVPNGVPGQKVLPECAPPRERFTLGAMALFRPRKGMEVLLEALAILKRQSHLPEFHLRAVGGFETSGYEQELKQRAAQLGVENLVTWTGFTSNINAELAHMHLFVLPSLFGEGLPMVVLEAMAAGVPVVASAVEGIPEALRHETDGLLAEPGSAAALAEALGRVLRGEVNWSAMRASAWERHAARFSDGCMAAGVASVYREILPAS